MIDFWADCFLYVLLFFWVINIYDIESDRATNNFYNNLLHHFYCYSIILILFVPAGVWALYRIRTIRDKVPNIFFNKYTFCKHCPDWLVDKSGQFFLFDLTTPTKAIFVNISISDIQQLYNGYWSHNLFDSKEYFGY